MATTRSSERPLKPTDLRGILKYVPMFREHIFVIAIDGSIVEHENFQNLVTDIAVLRSLNINVVIVHGIGKQLRDTAARQRAELSDVYGEGATDAGTMEIACEAAGIPFEDDKAHGAAYDTQKECELFCALYNRFTTFAGFISSEGAGEEIRDYLKPETAVKTVDPSSLNAQAAEKAPGATATRPEWKPCAR